jgi:hypothetical protein
VSCTPVWYLETTNHRIEGVFNAPLFRGLCSQLASHRLEKIHPRKGRALFLVERKCKTTPFDERVYGSRRSEFSDGAERSYIESQYPRPNETRETNETINSKEEIFLKWTLKITIVPRGYMRAQSIGTLLQY